MHVYKRHLKQTQRETLKRVQRTPVASHPLRSESYYKSGEAKKKDGRALAFLISAPLKHATRINLRSSTW